MVSSTMHGLLTAVALLGLSILSSAFPLTKRNVIGPVMDTDFPDPSIIRVGSTWYAFGTQSIYDHTNIKVQFATSSNFNTWSLHEGHDALRTLPPWVDASNPKVWAPDVFQLDDGSFMLYFSATTNTAGNGRFHCIGAARSDRIEGPYDSVSDSPMACPTDLGGAIDASAFRDADGQRYLLYKIDGNAIGHGGLCNNEESPQIPTPIILQAVGEDGYTFTGEATEILNRDERDGPLVEGPSLVRLPGPVYVLHFSSQCYTSEHYSGSYATSDSILGKYEKARFPLLVSGTPRGVWGPGHADVDWDAQHMAFHAYAAKEDVGGRRKMYVANIGWEPSSRVVLLNE